MEKYNLDCSECLLHLEVTVETQDELQLECPNCAAGNKNFVCTEVSPPQK